MAANILDSFMIALGFQVDTEGIEKFQAKADALRASALRLGAIFTGAAVGIGIFVEHIAEGMGELQHFAELNQLSARSVAAWDRVAEENLITTESMQSSIQSLNIKTGEASKGIGRGAMIFKRFGLEAKDASGHTKSFSTILGDVADKMQHQSRSENLALAKRLGLDPKMVLLLEKGRAALASMNEEAEKLNPFSEEDYEKAKEVDVMFIKAKMTTGLLAKMLGTSLFPVVSKVLSAYLRWFKVMRASGDSTAMRVFHIMAAGAEALWGWVERLGSGVMKVVRYLFQFRVVVGAAGVLVGAMIAYKVGSFFVALSSAVATATEAMLAFDAATMLPVIAVGALLLAIGLLVDDLVNYYEGNDSVIGQLEKKFKPAIYAVWAAVIALTGGFIALKWTAISSMYETIAVVWMYATEWIAAHASMAVATLAAYAPILLIIAAIGLVVTAVWLLYRNWTDIYNYIAGTWTMLGEKVDEYVKKVQGAWQSVKGFFGFGGPSGNQMPQVAGGSAASGGSSSASGSGLHSAIPRSGVLGSGAGMAISHHSTTNQTTAHITVVTPDPARSGESVKKELDGMNRNTVRNGQSAVAL